MARKKVLLRYIQNAVSRKASSIKRRRSLLKKVEELSILCNVTACIVVYGEDPNEQPMYWPDEHEQVEEILWRFHACPDDKKKLVTDESFVEEMIVKYRTTLKRVRRTTNEHQMQDMMYLIYFEKYCHTEFQMNELLELRGFTVEKIRDLLRKGEFMAENEDVPPPPSPLPPGVPPTPPPPPPPPTFLGRLFFVGVQGYPTEEAQAMPPNPLLNISGYGSRLFPGWNFEVGGGSGTANDPNCDVVFGYGLLIPTGPAFPFQESSGCGGYLGDIPGIQVLMPPGTEASAGSAAPKSAAEEADDPIRGCGRSSH
ncbi:hypothetical protein MLD38_016089 [Melastoma candidum]|uniref:Uncharacterized protein n=1 Tax=Melastoma candidum TaxID=119954 RepID=A0ACB9RIV5_9MYRT|nr:hypothetical protein MLD38_016089 [Melastoma candidum]